MEGVNKTSKATMADLVSFLSRHPAQVSHFPTTPCLTFGEQFATYNFDAFNSNAGVRSDLFKRPLKDALVTDFFGGVTHVEVGDPSEEVGLDFAHGHDSNSESRQSTSGSPSESAAVLESAVAFESTHDDTGLVGGTARSYLAIALVIALFGFSSLRR